MMVTGVYQRRPRILVVDADRASAERSAQSLSDLGADVAIAATADAARDVASTLRPEVAILDLATAPIDAICELRKSCHELHCITLASAPDVDAVVACFRRGAVDFLRKPVDPTTLRRAVERCIQIRREKVEALEALRRSEERYRQLANASHEAVFIHDDKRILEANAAFEALFGGPPAAFADAPPPSLWAPESRDAYAELLTAPDNATAELVGTRRGAGTFHARVRVASLPEAGPAVHVTVVSDMTAQRCAEARQRDAEDQLRKSQKMEAIGLLTGGIAHDFNNVLQGIIGFTNLATRRIKEGRIDSLESYLHEIHGEATRSRELVASLLLYSRGGKSETEVLAVEPVVSQTLALLRSALPRRVQLTGDVARGVRIRTNATQLQQLVMNLCINARDALPESGGRIDVTLSRHEVSGVCASCGAKVDGRFVELAVTDDGAGIPPEAQSRVFDPFFTTKEIGKGTGMGLAVTHGITHEHGGHILLRSYPGHTRFGLVFPIPADATDEVFEAPPKSLVKAPSPRRLMVVDDEVIVADYLAALFSDAGYSVASFTDPKAAVAAFDQDPHAWDLVITDQMMPSLNGDRLARTLRERRPEIPIVLCSGYADDQGLERPGGLRVDAVLEKPYEAETALGIVRQLLDKLPVLNPDGCSTKAGT